MKKPRQKRKAAIKWHSRVPWVDKLRPDLKPKVVEGVRGFRSMLVPTPLLLADQIRKVRRGRITTVSRLREALAARYGVESTCPLTTGILLHVVAGASEERIAAGGLAVKGWSE